MHKPMSSLSATCGLDKNWLGVLKKKTTYTGFPDIVGNWLLELVVDDTIVVAIVLAVLVVLIVEMVVELIVDDATVVAVVLDMVVEIGVPLEA